MDIKDKDIKDKIKTDIETAENFFDQVIKPKLIARYKIYYSDPEYYAQIFKKLSQRSNIVSSDVSDTIEWALPSLMRIFFGGEEVISIIGREREDQRKAELMQKLINFQITTLNPGFLIFYTWFKDALITGLGIIKAWWERDVEKIPITQIMTSDEVEMLKNVKNVEIVRKEMAENNEYWYVTYRVSRLIKNQPVLLRAYL